MMFTLIFGAIGFFGLGISLHYKIEWIVPLLFICMLFFGLSFLNIAVYGYLGDCLRNHAPEAFASINVRNCYLFGICDYCDADAGINYFIAQWIDSQGPLKVFAIIGGIHIFIISLTLPMYVFGKKARSWTARKTLFKNILHSSSWSTAKSQ